MQNLPTAEVYDRENRYMPWGMLVDEVAKFVKAETPDNGSVLDLLCGPGYLLNLIQRQRPDLHLTGIDLEGEYIEYAKRQYPGIDFITADASTWESPGTYDGILCTAGLHHLPYDAQESFLRKVAGLMKDGGFALVADPYVPDYTDEQSRKLAGAKLGYEYLVATIHNGADEEVIRAAVGILMNDVLLVEFKSSIQKIKPLFEKHFSNMEIRKTWPKEESGYGDYLFVLRK